MGDGYNHTGCMMRGCGRAAVRDGMCEPCATDYYASVRRLMGMRDPRRTIDHDKGCPVRDEPTGPCQCSLERYIRARTHEDGAPW